MDHCGSAKMRNLHTGLYCPIILRFLLQVEHKNLIFLKLIKVFTDDVKITKNPLDLKKAVVDEIVIQMEQRFTVVQGIKLHQNLCFIQSINQFILFKLAELRH